MRCLKPYRSEKDKRYYPCGRCLTCRIQRREDWSLRMIHELQYWDKSMFVTLTYDDEHLPKNKSLNPDDLANFWKLLRIRLVRERGKDFNIKYFACGEYGPKTHRPHYHAVIYGLSWKDKDDVNLIKDCWTKCKPHMWLPKFQRGRWRQAIAPVVPQSIRYVCGYVFKKAVDSNVDNYITYVRDNKGIDLYPVFQRQSQGIGKRFCLENRESIIRRASCFNHPVPRYYRKLLNISEKTNPAFANISLKQKRFYDEFVRLDDVQRKACALPKTFYKDYDSHMAGKFHVEHEDIVHYFDNLVTCASDESMDFIAPQNVRDYLDSISQAPVWLSNLDYDDIRLHAYSRRYNK